MVITNLASSFCVLWIQCWIRYSRLIPESQLHFRFEWHLIAKRIYADGNDEWKIDIAGSRYWELYNQLLYSLKWWILCDQPTKFCGNIYCGLSRNVLFKAYHGTPFTGHVYKCIQVACHFLVSQWSFAKPAVTSAQPAWITLVHWHEYSDHAPHETAQPKNSGLGFSKPRCGL